MSELVGALRIRVPVNVEAELAALKNLYVMTALRAAQGNHRQAAELLGIKYERFQDWIRAAELRTATIAAAEGLVVPAPALAEPVAVP